MAGSRTGGRRSGWTRTRALLSLGMVAGLGAVGTMAAWSDSVTVTTGTFSTANVELLVNDQTSHTFSLAGPEVMPGTSLAGQIEVQNRGSIKLDYSAVISATGTSALIDAMTVAAYKDATASNGVCTGANRSAVGPAVTDLDTEKSFVTERGPLAAGTGTESLCIEVQIAQGIKKAASFSDADLTISFTGVES